MCMVPIGKVRVKLFIRYNSALDGKRFFLDVLFGNFLYSPYNFPLILSIECCASYSLDPHKVLIFSCVGVFTLGIFGHLIKKN